MHPVEQHYRDRREKAKEMPPEEKDWWALDQGKQSSLTRFKTIAESVRGLNGRVLDLACGTGAMLETFAELGKRPYCYIGVDGLQEHQKDVLERLDRLELPGMFLHKPMEVRFEDFDATPPGGGVYDAAICTGLLGFWGYHSQRQLKSLYTYMRSISRHGGIMVPMAWNHENLGDSYIRRWPLDDVTDLLQLSDEEVVQLPREFLIRW